MADILNFSNGNSPFGRELDAYFVKEMERLHLFAVEMVAKHFPKMCTSREEFETASIVFAAIMTEEWHGSLKRKAVERLGNDKYEEMVTRFFSEMTLVKKGS